MSAQALETGCERCGGDDFERMSGQEGQNAEGDGRLSRGMGENGQPEGSAGQNCEVAGRGAGQGRRKAAPAAPPQERNQGNGKGISEEVAAGGSEQVG